MRRWLGLKKISRREIVMVSTGIIVVILFASSLYPFWIISGNDYIESSDLVVNPTATTVTQREFVSTGESVQVIPIITTSQSISTITKSNEPFIRSASAITSDQVTVDLKEWSIPTPSSALSAITVDASSNVWFAEESGNKIGRFVPSTNEFTEWGLLTDGRPTGIVVYSGNVFFTEPIANRIARLDPSTNTITEWPIPTASSGTREIAVDSAGNIFFIEEGAKKIGRLVTSTNTFTEWAVPLGGSVSFIALDSSGNVFTTDGFSKARKLNPSTNTYTEWIVDTALGFRSFAGIALDFSGNVFFTQQYNFCSGCGTIVGLEPFANTITRWDIPGGGAPTGIATDASGNAFFLEVAFGNQIGRLVPSTASNVITEWTIPTPSSGPTDVTVDSSGNVWFTERSVNKIARLA